MHNCLSCEKCCKISMKNENINLKIHLNCVNGGLDKFSLLLRKGAHPYQYKDCQKFDTNIINLIK